MQRVRVPELMDDPLLGTDEHTQALKSLNRVNRALGVDRQLTHCVAQIAPNGARSILDLGAGGGGFLGFFRDHGTDADAPLLVALDCSRVALQVAAEWQGGAIRCVAADARRLPLADRSVDVVTSSLFLHHLDPPDVIAVLREAARVATKGIVMGDLTRSRTALAATWLASRLLSRSRIFRVDGPRSVRAAFRMREFYDMAAQAGLYGARIEARFPFRAVLMWRNEHSSTIV